MIAEEGADVVLVSEAWHDVLGFGRRGRQEVGLDDEVLEHIRHLYSLSEFNLTILPPKGG